MSLPGRIRRYVLKRILGGLRFPQLFVLTTLVFVADLAIPDGLPLVDEILLGLLSLLLASIRRKKDDEEDGSEGGPDGDETGNEKGERGAPDGGFPEEGAAGKGEVER